MPVLEVELIGEVASETRRGLAARIAESVAAVLKAEPQSVWVRLRFTPSTDYAENSVPAPGVSVAQDALSAQPIFVKVVQRAWPSKDAMKREARGLAAAIGDACHRQTEDVHIIYEPPGAGRVAFGGSMVE